VERRGPAGHDIFDNTEGTGEMTKAPIKLQDLRRRIYTKAKAEPAWRFWGLYVHVCKLETLRAAYVMAKKNNGAPGVDGVTFEAIEAQGVEPFLEQIRGDLARRTYCPQRVRRVEIPKAGGKFRQLSIPTMVSQCTSYSALSELRPDWGRGLTADYNCRRMTSSVQP
jgi:RNA-directed DNA polymerase